MSSDVAVAIDSVWKLFRLQKQKTMKEMLPALFGGKATSETFWALQNVDLRIKKGETFGIIGPNGSGKSTLLKLIAGVTQPTKGSISVNGRIAPLIELGAGFHPELTGRENVYLNGVILGLKRQEIDEQFKDIVDFAELWDFIDQPIKHYSSGMYLRLAFAVAVHTKPEILLVDEILAVGDGAFQEKCLKRMKAFQDEGKTIIIVTHAMATVEQYCQRACYIHKSKVEFVGNAKEAVEEYRNKTS
ncbi:ABC transporter ATP-binding protein [Candidatus Woesebacteria bacterium]|nr:ABC transporter ATP-binding protein [Candidatus Woesebacteria bacterium]